MAEDAVASTDEEEAREDEKDEASQQHVLLGILDVARMGRSRNGQLRFLASWDVAGGGGDTSWEPLSSFEESVETLLGFLSTVDKEQQKAFKKGELKRLIKDLEQEVAEEQQVVSALTAEIKTARQQKIVDRLQVLKAVLQKGGADDDPATVKAAKKCADWPEFKADADEEFKYFIDKGVMELVPRPKGKNIVSCKWVFKRKRKNGVVERRRSRLVCRGFVQKAGQDYDPAELYAPTMRSKSFNVLVHLAANEGMELRQYDVSKAFVHANLEEEVYMEQPEMYVVAGKESYVYRLRKALYGLKQSPRAFGKHMTRCLKAAGFEPADSDECMWVADKGTENAVYALYHVDDILMASKNPNARHRKFMQLRDGQGLDLRDEGVADVFLAIKMINNEDGSISLSQKHYITDVAERFDAMSDDKVETPGPADLKMQLSKSDCPANDKEALAASKVPYPALIGCLIYLVRTRPEISFAVSDLAQYMSNWGVKHFEQALRVLKYLYHTRDQMLTYTKGNGKNVLRCYVDANYGDGRDSGEDKWRSQGGYLVYLDNNLVYWSSKRHKCVTLSSMEAEYVEASRAGQEVLWFRRLLGDLGHTPVGPTVVYEDNKAAISFSKNHTCHDRSKHIDIRHFWLREMVTRGDIRLLHVGTLEQAADILTKYLPTKSFRKFRDKMLHGVEKHPEGECAKMYAMFSTVNPKFVEGYMGGIWVS